MIHFKQNLLALLALCLTSLLGSNMSYAQKQIPFTGMLEYRITSTDTSNNTTAPVNKMFVYTNDTITRTENFTRQLGQQVAIRHIEKQKSYLLLVTDLGKFAIQTDHSKSDTIQKEPLYVFQRKWFKRKIAGQKANRILVSHPGFQEPIEFLYLKNRSNKYLNIHTEIPGLLLKYSIQTTNGTLNYELVTFQEYTPNNDLFGIPSDFDKISFDDFLTQLIKAKKEAQSTPQ